MQVVFLLESYGLADVRQNVLTFSAVVLAVDLYDAVTAKELAAIDAFLEGLNIGVLSAG